MDRAHRISHGPADEGVRQRWPSLLVRVAVPDDAARIAEIYNYYVLHSTITFDTEPKSVEERLRWLDEHDESHPVLVGEVDGKWSAWGALTKWGTRSAYRHTVEVSAYVDREFCDAASARA